MATYKLFAKQIVVFICAVSAGIIAGVLFRTFVAAVVPLLFALVPAGLTAFYIFLFRKDKVGEATVTCTGSKHDIVGGLISSLTVTRRKYQFAYTDEDGNARTFSLSRSGWLNTFKKDEEYVVLYNTDRPIGSDNVIEWISLASVKED